MSADIYTIGHSTHSIDKLLGLLNTHGISAIADVRSRPFSRMNPQFNRDFLTRALKAKGIAYSFLGRELGARPEDPSCYVHGRARYELIARTALFEEGLARVADGAARFRLALLCAEKDPMACHRAMLVCRHLVDRGFFAKHILADGKLEDHDDALRRAASEVGTSLVDLFRSRSEILEEVYARRTSEIEYVDARDSEST